MTDTVREPFPPVWMHGQRDCSDDGNGNFNCSCGLMADWVVRDQLLATAHDRYHAVYGRDRCPKCLLASNAG